MGSCLVCGRLFASTAVDATGGGRVRRRCLFLRCPDADHHPDFHSDGQREPECERSRDSDGFCDCSSVRKPISQPKCDGPSHADRGSRGNSHADAKHHADPGSSC